MYCKTNSCTIDGVDGVIVVVEADVSDGLPLFDMVGLLASEVREAKERVRIAIKNSGYDIPPKRITINLSPADVRKSGTGFDLAIAIDILAAMGIIPCDVLTDTVIIGELGLDGKVVGINGILPRVLETASAGLKRVIVPKSNENEAAVVKDIDVFGVESLCETVDFLIGKKVIQPVRLDLDIIFKRNLYDNDMDFFDVSGQETLKRAIQVAVAGMHNILLIGPPGAGKTMIAQRIAGIMPALTYNESLEISKIYSVAGLLDIDEGIMVKRPYRSPHHTITTTAMAGGGRPTMPGEVSLASKGVLFLDELPEFNKNVLEVLRQPLEERYVNISRLGASYKFSADILLVCAMNPCKCGYYPDRNKCHCSDVDIRRYLGKISRPLLDRIDICVEAERIDYDKISQSSKGQSSQDMRKNIEKARDIQLARFKGGDIHYNSQMKESDIKKYCILDDKGKHLLEEAFKEYEMTVRGYYRVLKVARTIADLDGSEKIQSIHVSEAICYRSNDDKYWGSI